MKKSVVLGLGLCVALSFSACKSSESAYKKAYEKAKQKELAEAQAAIPAEETVQVSETAVVAAPVEAPRVVESVAAPVRQEKVTVVTGAEETLKDFSVVCGSFGVKANADGLKSRLEADGYQALVVYNADANADNGDSNIARTLHCYLYGSEGTPTATNRYDSQGYPIYSYGSNALACEYVGGSATADLVLLRVKTEELRRINAGAVAVQFAEDYRVGETAIVIGNAEDLGTSVTEGIVSVDREKVRLSDVDGVTRTVFDAEGKLIGILNSGSREAQNINFAIPVETVAGVAENIYYYATDGDDSTEGVYKVTLGVTVQYDNSRYEYDASTGYGSIRETITVQSVTGGSLADEMGLQSGDVLQSVTIDGKTYFIDRQYDLDDALYRLQPGESCSLTYLRDGKVCESSTVLAEAGDCSAID